MTPTDKLDTGGAAFPVPEILDAEGDVSAVANEGMDLLDAAALRVLAVLVADYPRTIREVFVPGYLEGRSAADEQPPSEYGLGLRRRTFEQVTVELPRTAYGMARAFLAERRRLHQEEHARRQKELEEHRARVERGETEAD